MDIIDGQRKALNRLSDYPKRVERLKRLWIDVHGGGNGYESSSRLSCAGSAAIRRAGAYAHFSGAHGPSSYYGWEGRHMAAYSMQGPLRGLLSASQIGDLMTRELTPEDYEVLLLLDEGVRKTRTLSAMAASNLTKACNVRCAGGACSICLSAFEDGEDVRILPACGHSYHADCIKHWLTKSRAACPLCGTEVAQAIVKN
jgi:hypothetical protein